jgi:hypothetical protein
MFPIRPILLVLLLAVLFVLVAPSGTRPAAAQGLEAGARTAVGKIVLTR